MFVPFSPQIVAYALEQTERHESENWEFLDSTYAQLGYVLTGDRAERPPRPFPFR
jgi:phosphate-selective porin